MDNPYAISDWFWDAIKDLCPGKAGDRGRTAKDNRLFVDAVVYVLRSGMPWHLLPKEFGNYKCIHNRFMRWARTGVWKRIFETVARDSDVEFLYIDSTINRAHQHSAGAKHSDKQTECIGRSSGGLSTKIHTLCDALSYPVAFFLTPGQDHDLTGADALLNEVDSVNGTLALVADQAYDADEGVLARLQQVNVTAVIPPKGNRKQKRDYDRYVYKSRHLIENFFQKLKNFRDIASRYAKTAVSYLSAVYLASAIIWLQ